MHVVVYELVTTSIYSSNQYTAASLQPVTSFLLYSYILVSGSSSARTWQPQLLSGDQEIAARRRGYSVVVEQHSAMMARVTEDSGPGAFGVKLGISTGRNSPEGDPQTIMVSPSYFWCRSLSWRNKEGPTLSCGVIACDGCGYSLAIIIITISWCTWVLPDTNSGSYI